MSIGGACVIGWLIVMLQGTQEKCDVCASCRIKLEGLLGRHAIDRTMDVTCHCRCDSTCPELLKRAPEVSHYALGGSTRNISTFLPYKMGFQHKAKNVSTFYRKDKKKILLSNKITSERDHMEITQNHTNFKGVAQIVEGGSGIDETRFGSTLENGIPRRSTITRIKASLYLVKLIGGNLAS